MSKKDVILTGLRANNELHIGNYFGGLLPIVDMAKQHSDTYQINLFVPDLHSFTTPIDHSRLPDQIKSALRSFVAAGLPLDNPDVHIYRQSHIPAHSELMWILSCFTGMGEMGRMTQFKDKSAKLGEDRISVGLFNYPILMAADILLYKTKYVPVGEDQTQHLEFARDIAERINKTFGEDLFAIPLPIKKQHEFFGKDQSLRVKDLVDPSKKMSKSDKTGKGVIFLTDNPKTAHKKIMSATTDNMGQVKFDPVKQPGISNLLKIYSLLLGLSIDEAAKEFIDLTSYAKFKQKVADEVSTFLSGFQKKLAEVNQNAIDKKLDQSEEAVSRQANQVLANVQKSIGLR